MIEYMPYLTGIVCVAMVCAAAVACVWLERDKGKRRHPGGYP